MLNLDTHILIDALAGKALRKEEKLLAADDWAISDIVLWEIAKLNQLGRISLNLASPGFRVILNTINIIPISADIARTSCELDFSADPADELIAATSIVHRMPLLTRDKTIRSSRLVTLA